MLAQYVCLQLIHQHINVSWLNQITHCTGTQLLCVLYRTHSNRTRNLVFGGRSLVSGSGLWMVPLDLFWSTDDGEERWRDPNKIHNNVMHWQLATVRFSRTEQGTFMKEQHENIAWCLSCITHKQATIKTISSYYHWHSTRHQRERLKSQ